MKKITHLLSALIIGKTKIINVDSNTKIVNQSYWGCLFYNEKKLSNCCEYALDHIKYNEIVVSIHAYSSIRFRVIIYFDNIPKNIDM